MASISSHGTLPPFRCKYFLSEIPSRYSITIYAVPFAEKKSRTETMPGRFFIFASILASSMKRLSPRENHIINLRFFEGKTQMEVAEEIHISQAQVSRLEKNALGIMKTALA